MNNKRKPPSNGPPGGIKKSKGSFDDDDFDFPGSFEEELAYMDAVEAESKASLESQEIIGQGPETVQTSGRWSRPLPPPLDPAQDVLVFQQLDVDHYRGFLEDVYVKVHEKLSEL